MPLYEYQCDACSHRFERIQKFSDPPVETCPACGGSVRKLLSSPAIQFKGTGWYVTDYAKKSSKDGKGSEGTKSTDASTSTSSGDTSSSSSSTTSSSSSASSSGSSDKT